MESLGEIEAMGVYTHVEESGRIIKGPTFKIQH